MSKLSRLSERIRSIPDIDRERERLTLAETVGMEIGIVADGLEVVIGQAPNINTLIPSGLIDAVKEALMSAAEQSKRLKKLIQRESFGSEQKISEHLDSIKRIKASLETKRNREWDKVKEKIKSVEIILSIASKLNLDSVTSLRDSASRFRAATISPPSCPPEVEQIKVVISGCETVIANSGLKGNVKTLLEGAIAGNGDPRLLLDGEVQQFFKDHPNLWRVFRLRLV